MSEPASPVRLQIVKAQASIDTGRSVLISSKPDPPRKEDFILQIIEDPALHERVLESGAYRSYWWAEIDGDAVRLVDRIPDQKW